MVDVPGAFIQAEMPGLVHVQLNFGTFSADFFCFRIFVISASLWLDL